MKDQCYILLLFITFLGCKVTKSVDKNIYCTASNNDVVINSVKGSNLSLESGEKYIFVLINLNDAYYGVDYAILKTKKSITLPAILSPYLSPSQTNVTAAVRKAQNQTLPAQTITNDFKTTLFLEDSMLSHYNEMIDGSVNVLDSVRNDITACKTDADNFISEASDRLGIIGSNKECKVLSNKVDFLIEDFKNRVQLLKSNRKLRDDPESLKILQENEFINKNEKGMRVFVDLLAAYQKCIMKIPSKPYNVNKADFIDVAFTIYGRRFAAEKDTLLTQTIRFYRIRYFSLDVSAGFFGTNLLSQSYRFTDTMGGVAAESNSKGDLSAGALVHLNYAFGPGFKAGPCVGAALSVMDAKPQVFWGISFVIGRSKEFAISGGFAYSYLPVPSNVLKTGYASTPESTVPVYNKFITGCFIGLTYNIIQK